MSEAIDPVVPVATADPSAGPSVAMQPVVKTSSRRPLVMGAVLAMAAAVGTTWYVTHRGLESTDNAQIDAEVVAVPARTGGTVVKVHFVENQTVKSGDLLIELDDVPAKARLAQAEAGLAAATAAAEAADADASVSEVNATGNRSVAEASLQTASTGAATSADQIKEGEAQARAAEATRAQALLERDRVKSLLDSGAGTRSELEQAETTLLVATSSLDAARSHVAGLKLSAATAQSRVAEASAKVKQNSDVDALIKLAQAHVRSARAQVETAKATRDLAALDVSYTKICAPQDGVVSKKTVVVGQLVSPGQTISQLVTPALWVSANFKETQVASMRTGQPVHVEVDAFPGVDLRGEVESFSGATGARFTLLPPDNASGNFTKVVQRVPVRIKLNDTTQVALRPGMNVELTVDTRK